MPPVLKPFVYFFFTHPLARSLSTMTICSSFKIYMLPFLSEWVNFENKNSPSLSFSFWSCWALWKITLYYHSWTIIHFLELLGNPRFACEEVKNCGCSSTKILLAHHSLTELIMPTIIQLSRFCRTLYKWKCGLHS